jgi:hypothetical protein
MVEPDYFNGGRPAAVRCLFTATHAAGDFLKSPISCVVETPSFSAAHET